MRLLFVFLLFVLGNVSFAQDKSAYTYYVDLTEVVDDKLKVNLSTPQIEDKEVTFYMPVIIPGTYAIADYGRFVTDFKAFDKKGKELKTKREDDNTWVISKANKLSRISYWVDDSWDFTGEGPEVFQPAGTNIEEGKNFVINTAGFFGYFDSMKGLPVNINIVRNEEFYGGTGLIPQSPPISVTIGNDLLGIDKNEKIDTFTADSYDHLIDSPLMYSKADTAVIKVANTEVLVSTYSPNGTITAKEIAETIKETLSVQSEYLGGILPVDKYAFIFYFTDQPVLSYGALEHSYSSLYFMPEATLGEMEQQLRDFAAHEFFHIITPLTIHSEEIHRFDFNQPKMSKHLWLYEGVTEYFAGNAQVAGGLISVPEYINMLREKLIISTLNYNDSLAFTDLSSGALGEYEDQYINVYQKGALIGMCLDIKLRSLSNGDMGLKDLVLKLSDKFGKDSFFNDDELFDTMAELSYPEIREFFSTYVEDGNPIPYDEYFDMVGITYQEESVIENVTMGFEQQNIGVDPDSGKLFIRNEDQLNAFGQKLGLKNDDILVKMNDKDIPPIGPEIQLFFNSILSSLEEGKEVSITVNREDENGESQELRLAAENIPVEIKQQYIIIPKPDSSEEEVALRSRWLRAN